MGTNYYHVENVCEHCGRGDRPEHIGKSSWGWTFSFHGAPAIRCYRDWLNRLKAGGKIQDEYGEDVSLEEFVEMVKVKRDAPHNHARECPEEGSWLDAEGHSFSEYEFS